MTRAVVQGLRARRSPGVPAERPRAAVVGGGIGGLVAAGVLARHGCAVTLFEAEAAVGGKAGTLEAGGVRLDVGPTLLAMPHLVRETFATLDATDLLPAIDELPLQCAYRFADGRTFDAHRDLAASAASAARLDPAEGPALEAFYGEAERIWRVAGEPYLEAPFEGMLDFVRRVADRGVGAVASALRMGTLADVAARHFRTAAMRQFAGRFATYAGASPYAVSGAYALVPWVEHAYGVHHVRGGMGALVLALEAAVRRLGVTIRTDMRVGWRPRGTGFGVGPGRDGQWFDTVVVNADPAAGTSAPLTLSGYVLLLDVAERVRLPHHTVAFSADYPAEFAALSAGRVPDDATVYVCHPAATDTGMAPAGRSGLYVMTNLPPLAREPASWERVAPHVRAACLARLEALVPGVARRARIVGERTPLDLARLGAPAGAIYGFLPHGLLGPFRRPRMRGTPRGLFWAGGGTHPGGGVPLVMLSGRFAAGMALEHVGIREAA